MRVICDAPGQTCNRLWTYVTSVARCIAERRRMVIIFYDWTIEDFPHLLGAPFIYFPLWQKWYLERDEDHWKVVLTEEEFAKRMFEEQ